MEKKKIKLVLFTIIGLIGVFMPFGLTCYEYTSVVYKNCYLWKPFNLELLDMYIVGKIIGVVNVLNVILIIAVAFFSVLYVVKKNEYKEDVIKRLAIAQIALSLFFSYNVSEPFCYKFINIGMILVFVSNILIVVTLTEFNKANLLVLATSLLLTFPSMIVHYRVDIESDIQAIPCSTQMYTLMFISGIGDNYLLSLINIPALVMIALMLVTVVLVLGDNKHKNAFVLCLIISIIITFVLEIVLVILIESLMDLTYTYVVAIILLIIYLIINKKDKKINN